MDYGIYLYIQARQNVFSREIPVPRTNGSGSTKRHGALLARKPWIDCYGRVFLLVYISSSVYRVYSRSPSDMSDRPPSRARCIKEYVCIIMQDLF